jgi:hypothetical protein
MDWPKLDESKYKIGDIVSSKKYEIEAAMIIGIKHYGRDWNMSPGIDYELLIQVDNENWIEDGLSEENID